MYGKFRNKKEFTSLKNNISVVDKLFYNIDSR